MGFIASLTNSLSSNLLDLLVYAIIVFVFIMGLIRCVFPVVGTRNTLTRAVRVIRSGQSGKQSWQEDSFLGKGALSAHWSEYLNNLFFADGVYHNASNVEDYINEETVIYGPGRAAFNDAVPGLLVSIGFLGTLIGLAKGLSGFSMSDSESVMSSIVTLIPGMRYAFMTSIFGVVGSISFTLITKAVHGSTEHVLRSFYGAMSRYAGVLSVDPMTQVAIYQQEQTALIHKLADSLDGRLSEDIAGAVAKAVEPMSQNLKNFISVNTRDQMRFLDAVITRFLDRMDEQLGGQLKHFARVLDDTAAYQEKTLRSVETSLSDTSKMLEGVREVTRVADEMVRNNARYIESLRENQKLTDDAFSRISSSVEQMDLVSRQQSNYLKSVSAMQAEVVRSVDQMNGALTNFTQRITEESADATAGLLKAGAELRATGASLQEIHRDCASSITGELKLTLDAYQDYVNQFTQRVDYLAGSISSALGKLPGAVSDSSAQFLDQIDRLSETLAKAQAALDARVDQLYGAARPRR